MGALWEQVKRSIKATPNRSRLEGFTEYVKANPNDELSVSQANATGRSQSSFGKTKVVASHEEGAAAQADRRGAEQRHVS